MPWPVAWMRKPPSPPNMFLKPPHFVSSSTPADDASQQPFVTNIGWSGSDAGHDDVAGEEVGDVDPAARRPAR